MIPPPSDAVCPEKQLLICCARVRMQPDIAEKHSRLVSGPLDWDYLFAEAAENSLIPLLHRSLTPYARSKVPTAQMDALEDRSARKYGPVASSYC